MSCGIGPGACDPPSDVNADGSGTDAALIAFLTALATHVGTKITYWEAWNEANISSEYAGTWQQLVRMAEDMRSTVRKVNPSAIMLSPSFAEYTYQSAANKQAAYLATVVRGQSGSQQADIISFHGYVVTPSLPVPIAENQVVNLNNLRRVLAKADLAKPLWDTEWGPGIGTNNASLNAAFIARHMLIEAGQGVTRQYYYDWDSRDQRALWSETLGNCLGSGVPDAGGYLCETGATYQQVARWLAGSKVAPCVGPLPPAVGVWTCSIAKDGKDALAVWDTSQTCTGGACATSAYICDTEYTGMKTLTNDTWTAVSGKVQIGAKPILLVH